MRTMVPALAFALPLLMSSAASAGTITVSHLHEHLSGGAEAGVALGMRAAAEPAGGSTDAPTMDDASSADSPEPASDPVPEPGGDPVDEPTEEGPLAEESGPAVDDAGDPTATAADDAPTLEDERAAVNPGGYNAHGVGARAGLTIVPTAFLSLFLASHTNAQCRSTVGSVGMEKGNMRNEGCNWYVGGEYVYRKSRAGY